MDSNSTQKAHNLIFCQRSLRLRHLQKIVGLNLVNLNGHNYNNHPPPDILPSINPRKTVKYGYYFTLETTSCKKSQYKSEIESSKNPSWKSFDIDIIFPIHLLSQKGVVVRIYYKGEESVPHLITTWGIHFSGLVPLPENISLTSYEYPSNTIILKLNNLFYASYDSLANLYSNQNIEHQLPKLQTGFPLALSETKPSYSLASLCRLHSTKRAQMQQEQKRETLKENLKRKGATQESGRMLMKRKVENMYIKINFLKQHLQTKKSKLVSLLEAVDDQETENQDKGIELLQNYRLLNRSLNYMKTQEKKLLDDHTTLSNTVSKVKERRLQLFFQLPLVFPIRQLQGEKKLYSICDIHLPDAEHYAEASDQSISVGLGFAAQLLTKIAHIVNIPLRYPVTLFGSVSTIADLTSTQLMNVDSPFPLYTRGKDKEKLHFNYAVFLLNKNIAQIRWNCGLATSDMRQTLGNIESLKSSLMGTDESPARSFMADLVVSSPKLPALLRFNVETPIGLDKNYSLPLSENVSSKGDLATDKMFNKKEYFSDFSFSESENEIKPSSLVTTEEVKSGHQQVTKCPHPNSLISYSLDNGLDCISEFEVPPEKSVSYSNLGVSSSGSVPNLSVEDRDTDSLDGNTIFLLKSWHEDNPTPYKPFMENSNGEEKIDSSEVQNEDPSVVDASKIPNVIEDMTPPPTNLVLKFDSKDKPASSITVEVDESLSKVLPTAVEALSTTAFTAEKLTLKGTNGTECRSEESTQSVSVDTETQPVLADDKVQKIKILNNVEDLSLSDFGLSDDSFLNDMASRTANLANQNCSFKYFQSKNQDQQH